MAKMNRPEQALQKVIVQYLEIMEGMGRLTFFHPPNGGFRTMIEAVIFKAMGVKAGVPDLFIFGTYPRIAIIELKAPKPPKKNGKARKITVSDNQEIMHDRFASFGWKVFVCTSLDEVEAIVEEHIL